MTSDNGLTDDQIIDQIFYSSSPPTHFESESTDIYETDHTYAHLQPISEDGGDISIEKTTDTNIQLDELPDLILPEDMAGTEIYETNLTFAQLQPTPEDGGDISIEKTTDTNIQLDELPDLILPEDMDGTEIYETNPTFAQLQPTPEDGGNVAITNDFAEILYLDNQITVEIVNTIDQSEVLYTHEQTTEVTETYDHPKSLSSELLVTADDLFEDSNSDPDYIPSDNEDSSVDKDNCDNMANATSDEIPSLNRRENDTDEERPVLPDRKRKKNNSMNAKKNINKKLRMTGKSYVGYRRTKEGKVFQDQDREERQMGPPCQSNMCKKSKVRHCYSFTQEQRKDIFNNFWSGMSWDQRKVYIANMVMKTVVKRRTSVVEGEDDTSRRGDTLQYFLSVNGMKRQVCQKMFLQTLGVKKWTIRYWISGEKNKRSEHIEKHTSVGMVPQASVTRPSSAKKSKKPQAKEFAKSFLDSLAKLPSHYCRKSSTRLYLEPIFRSLSQVFSIYKDYCLKEVGGATLILSRNIFEKMFKEMNLAIYLPKKDRCDVCVGHEVGNISDEEYNKHIQLKDEARNEKDTDKTKAKENKCHIYCSDVQAVKLCPMLQASALYYKTKLNVHNFTMYNMATKEVQCFWFDETSADLVASVFASCVIETLKSKLEDDPKPVVLWSDGCPYQNKNAVFSNALLHLAVEKDITIEQKFLVKGHTQMECDSVHSTIETALKDKVIHLPSQYHQTTLEARKKPFPYKSKFLSYSDFKDFSKKETLVYDSIRPGRGVGDPTVYDIRAIRYNPNGKMETKLDFNSNYVELPRRPKTNSFVTEFPFLYKEPIQLKISKFKHLQELKCVIPKDCHPFYDQLPHF